MRSLTQPVSGPRLPATARRLQPPRTDGQFSTIPSRRLSSSWRLTKIAMPSSPPSGRLLVREDSLGYLVILTLLTCSRTQDRDSSHGRTSGDREDIEHWARGEDWGDSETGQDSQGSTDQSGKGSQPWTNTSRKNKTISQGALVERLVGGKIAKQAFIDQEGNMIRKKQEALEKIMNIIKSF